MARRRLLAGAGQFSIMVAVGILLGLGQHLGAQNGFFTREGSAALARAYGPVSLGELSHDEFSRQVEAGAVLVDARYANDFQMGHVPGAIHIPLGAREHDRLMAMDGVDRGGRVIVYCQSDSCPFADVVAARLAGDGFTNVAVYRAGWAGWVASAQGGTKTP